MQNRNKHLLTFMASAAMVLSVLPSFAGTAMASSAPQFASVVVRLDNITASNGTTIQYTGGTVCAVTPASSPGLGTETDLDLAFPTEEATGGGAVPTADDFHVSTTAANWIASNVPPTGLQTGQGYWPSLNSLTPTAWPNIGGGATGGAAIVATDGNYAPGNPASLKIVRFATGNLTANTEYCFDFKDGSGTLGAETPSTFSLQTPFFGANGYQENVPGFVASYHCGAPTTCTAVSAGTIINSSNWGTQISGNNSIVISAVVPPILVLHFAANTDQFVTNLDPNIPVVTSGVVVTIQTNAKGGWIMWTKDQNQALKSAASGGSIPTVGWNTDAPTTITGSATPGTGNPAYAMDAATGTAGLGATNCTAQPEAEYNGSIVSPFAGGALTKNWSETADCSTATPPGTDSGTNVTLTEIASINFSTPAATDYTDIIWVVGAGQF